MTVASRTTPSAPETSPRWGHAAGIVAVAVALSQLEALQVFVENRTRPGHDRFLWRMVAMLPPWLLLAALVPAVWWLVRRFPLTRPRAALVHAAASIVFPLVHLGALTLFHRLLGDPAPLLPTVVGLLGAYFVFDLLAYWVIAGSAFAIATRRAPTPEGGEPRAAFRAQLLVRDGPATRVVPVESIDWIEARNYYARVHAAGRRHLVRESLSRLEATLDPSAFVRVHRSAIVRLARIAEVRGTNGRSRVVLVDGVELPVSRSGRAALRTALDRSGTPPRA